MTESNVIYYNMIQCNRVGKHCSRAPGSMARKKGMIVTAGHCAVLLRALPRKLVWLPSDIEGGVFLGSYHIKYCTSLSFTAR